ncbi:hypothetical protein SNE40_019676 [Patella caerulea]|uniref:Protein-tyrosine-phosphatase n=1 Tax=Patella caerulea TaxID=87958 RepID=A0AAN8JBP1_PATCE
MELTMFNQIAEINEHLFLSSAAAVRGEKIRSLGITHIINCTQDVPNLDQHGVETYQIHIDDVPSARLNVYFDCCADKIHQVACSGGKTLVHCVAGVSRSATICMVYLMKYYRVSLREAYLHVKKRRSVIHPNLGFWKQMVDYERTTLGSSSVKMVQSNAGLIPDVYVEQYRNLVTFPTTNKSSSSRYSNYSNSTTSPRYSNYSSSTSPRYDYTSRHNYSTYGSSSSPRYDILNSLTSLTSPRYDVTKNNVSPRYDTSSTAHRLGFINSSTNGGTSPRYGGSSSYNTMTRYGY